MAITEKVLFEEPTYHFIAPGVSHVLVNANRPVSVIGRFQNDSTNNHWPSLKRKGLVTSDVGSNWTAFESQVEVDSTRLDVICNLASDIYHAYRGPVLVGADDYIFDATDFFNLPYGYSDETDLIGYGTTAIARVLPTNPISDLPTAVGELLTEGLPRFPGMDILRNRRFTRHDIPSNYLGYEFGIKPFLSDLQKFRRAVGEAEKLIAQYVSKSGVVIRRGYEFPTVVDNQINVTPSSGGMEKWLGGPCQSQAAGYFQTAIGGWPGELQVNEHRERKTWFKGAFTYYLPPVGDAWSDKLLRQEAEMRYLYSGISVDTAWNLLPYSWAADWFTNAGDLIHNLAAFARDGLVMPWGYIMESFMITRSCTVRDAYVGRCRFWNEVDTGSNNNAHALPTMSTTYTAKYLRRRKATPFGFGLQFDGLTNRQKAITAALVLK
jgi:hypothetical protein